MPWLRHWRHTQKHAFQSETMASLLILQHLPSLTGSHSALFEGSAGGGLDRHAVVVRPGLGFGSFHTARRTLAGYEVMAMMRKGQVRGVGGRDMRTQATFVAELFQAAA